MTQTAIPFLFMRGGTSRGPYFNRADLPEDRDQLSQVLISVMGAGNPRNIDGLGGGNAVTTKVAMLSQSNEPGVDIDYFFAQVAVEEKLVDYGPTCGNILVGVGPAAIEMGLVKIEGDETRVKIRAVNTGALVEAVISTPGGQVSYEGDQVIDGVPGSAAPIGLNFFEVVGSRCGSLLPTGQPREIINDIEVTCIDVAMPMVIARARDFGISGYESQNELDENKTLFEKIESLRLEAGRRMGLGDVSKSVTPKFGLLSEARGEGNFNARYFMPWTCHPTLAVTGSQCLAACALCPGSIAEGLVKAIDPSPAIVRIEHPMGVMDVNVSYTLQDEALQFHSAGVVRTARLIARGEVMVPASIMNAF